MASVGVKCSLVQAELGCLRVFQETPDTDQTHACVEGLRCPRDDLVFLHAQTEIPASLSCLAGSNDVRSTRIVCSTVVKGLVALPVLAAYGIVACELQTSACTGFPRARLI